MTDLGGSHTDQGVQPADRIAGKCEGLQNNDSVTYKPIELSYMLRM